MNIQNIYLRNYRNYKELNLELSPNINIFTGLNAQGKTNIIEAVHFSSIGISHRTRTEGDLINWQSAEADIKIKFAKMNIASVLKFRLKKHAPKEINLNGEIIKQRDLPGALTMVLFSPEDLMLIKGAPLLRRRFVDIELSQVSLVYYNELVKYNRLLSQRNNLLKKIKETGAGADLLDIWDMQFACSAAFIAAKRIGGIKKLNEAAQRIHGWISGGCEDFRVEYAAHKFDKKICADMDGISVDQFAELYAEILKKYRSSDIFRGTTGVGPHRDDVLFFINGIDLKSFGSQGQQRSSVLSLKLAEMEFLKNETGEYPVLLLDDVMSELDGRRRGSLLSFLRERNIQTLITATDRDLFGEDAKNRFFSVRAGSVS